MTKRSLDGHEKKLQKILDKVGVVWEEFCSIYPDEGACWFALFDALSANNALFCRSCNSRAVQFSPLSRSTRCESCYRITWLTAGTVFHGARKLRPWMAAIWLFEHDIKISSSGFSFLLQIAQSSALNMYKSLFFVVNSEGKQNATEASSSQFLQIFNKRSLETLSWQHPVTEEGLPDKNFQEFNGNGSGAHCPHLDSSPPKTSSESTTSASEQASTECRESSVEKRILALLTGGEKTFDEICLHNDFETAEVNRALTFLELESKIVSLVGGKYGLVSAESFLRSPGHREVGNEESANSLSMDLEQAVESFCRLIKQEFHGISRKTIALYAALRQLPLSYEKLEKITSSRLLGACLFREPIGREQIRVYVSPQFFPFVTEASPAHT
ncbi:MAG: hypothetical protein HY986_11100 [Candidatus Melainabacteria bacterium]|nr:hypothetical protein [Candidatus Melainabacteria bacterium]